MSAWLDEIGSDRMGEKDIKLITGMFRLLKEAGEGQIGSEDKESLIKKVDNALYNLGQMKKVIEEEF